MELGVEISNNLLAAAGYTNIGLWDCKTLDRIQSFKVSDASSLAFSVDGTLLAALNEISINVFDVTSPTAIATLSIGCGRGPYTMAFLPDNSQLVVWRFTEGDKINSASAFLTFDLVTKETIRGPSFEKFIQLPDMPLWHGVPAWGDREGRRYYLDALFSGYDDPVPVLWIPQELDVLEWVQRRSMIAMGSKDGRVVLLRLPIATGTAARAGDDGNRSYGSQPNKR
ncbi:hypothetical protein M378DRAFT_13303 [Amanita muscaria Koide BX008]|nr:hypothetical protein M378DRAFT_13303 [Amanita muscaria Koide BX008]